jgi:CheY-like chemotaxis protein
MKWYNAVRDALPRESGKVILSIRGIYYHGLYDSTIQMFLYDENGSVRVLEKTNDQVYWHSPPPPDVIYRKIFKIVVADDDLDEQVFIKDALSTCKHSIVVDSVFSGVQLLDYLLKRNGYDNLKGYPDLIFLDLNMPVMDGFKTLAEIKKIDELRKIPVYILTTSRNTKDLTRAMDLGAQAVYSKGNSAKEIQTVVNEICDETLKSK